MVGHLYYNIPLETEKKFDHYCGEIYEKMRNLDDDVEFKQKLSEVLLAIEEGKDPRIMELHQTYTKACAKEQYQIMIKSDGVATYTAKDIAFALWKLGYIKENFGYEHFIEDPR